MRAATLRVLQSTIRANEDVHAWPVLICLLGTFGVLQEGRAVRIRGQGKIGLLLCTLAVRGHVPREELLDVLWPAQPIDLAGPSLHSLMHELVVRLGGVTAVVHAHGSYSLNEVGGVGVDTRCFEELLAAGDRQRDAGNQQAAIATYERAASFYRGDLCAGSLGLQFAGERERLRSSFLGMLVAMAEAQQREGAEGACLASLLRLLSHDPCCEHAHRMAMRCYMRLGERAQALRQYRWCEQALQIEFDAVPEGATISLFNQIRSAPDDI